MNDTDYLLNSKANEERLQESIKETKSKTTISDINSILALMQDMSIMELDEIKNECDYLIDNKMNEYTS